MQEKKKLLQNTFIIALGRCSTQVLSFLLLPLYTSLLSTSEYGNYDLLNTISIFIIPFITLLMEESMFRFLIDAKDEKEKAEEPLILYVLDFVNLGYKLIIGALHLQQYRHSHAKSYNTTNSASDGHRHTQVIRELRE